MPKIVIPIERFERGDSLIFQHFGRAPLYAVVELLENGSVKSISSVNNTGEHFAGTGAAEVLVSQLQPDALVVKGMGPRGLQAFQSKGIAVFTGEVNTVKEAVDAYVGGRLVGLTEPCREARHHLSEP